MRSFTHLKSQTRSSDRRAFTLVEILIVVIILGILASVVVPQFSSASQDSRVASLKSQLRAVRSAIEVYQMQHMDQSPNLSSGWAPLLTQTNAQGGTTGSDLLGPYLTSAPINTLSGGTTISNAARSGVDWIWDGKSISAVDQQGNLFIETP